MAKGDSDDPDDGVVDDTDRAEPGDFINDRLLLLAAATLALPCVLFSDFLILKTLTSLSSSANRGPQAF